jgi:hypothetical protein
MHFNCGPLAETGGTRTVSCSTVSSAAGTTHGRRGSAAWLSQSSAAELPDPRVPFDVASLAPLDISDIRITGGFFGQAVQDTYGIGFLALDFAYRVSVS